MEWPNPQLDPPLVASLCRLVVIHLMASYVILHGCKSVAIFISCKLLLSHTGNSRRLRPGHRSFFTNWSQNITSHSKVYHRSRAVVVVLWPESMPIDLWMACDGCKLTSLLWFDRKSLLLLGQLYTFCLLVCQSLPSIVVNTSLLSDDRILITAHKSKKSRIFSNPSKGIYHFLLFL